MDWRALLCMAGASGNLCIRGGVYVPRPSLFLSSHSWRSIARTEGKPPTWSPCLCERIISDTSGFVGSYGFAVSRRAVERTEMYSSFPSPVSIRVYGFSCPIIYVLVPNQLSHREMLQTMSDADYPAG